MLHAVDYLGDAYHAFSSWVLQESLDQVHLGKPALARAVSIIELNADKVHNAIYIQLYRYPSLNLQLTDTNILRVNVVYEGDHLKEHTTRQP
eukprot:2520880-Pleurochrysis_carterae.AAC.1